MRLPGILRPPISRTPLIPKADLDLTRRNVATVPGRLRPASIAALVLERARRWSSMADCAVGQFANRGNPSQLFGQCGIRRWISICAPVQRKDLDWLENGIRRSKRGCRVTMAFQAPAHLQSG